MKKLLYIQRRRKIWLITRKKKYSFSIKIDPKITQLLDLENKDSKAAIINMFMDLKKFWI